ELVCAAIDMGGGTTTISVFAEGKLVHTDAVGLGCHHVTTDLARGLSTRIEDAERLKVVMSGFCSLMVMVPVPSLSGRIA
ncbi:cell division FtsA domain-containing protein, partial [Rhizobium ruizarguesonis]